MNWYGNVSPRQRRTYNILITIIALTVPCYCLGLMALALAPSTRAGRDLTAVTLSPPSTTLIATITLPPEATQQLTPTEWQLHTVTPTPTSSPTHTGTPTSSPTRTVTATPSPTVSRPTETLEPSPSPTPEPTNTTAPTVTPVREVYTLHLAKRDGDSLFIANESERAFPLEPLRLGEGSEAINGRDWELDRLEPGECVTAWRAGGKPEAPSISCTQVGRRVTRTSAHRFWRSAFNIYYQGELVGTCAEEQCTIELMVN